MSARSEIDLFYMLEDSTLAKRLFQQLRVAASEFAQNPTAFIRSFSANAGDELLLIRLGRQLRTTATQLREAPFFYLRTVLPARGEDVLLARLGQQVIVAGTSFVTRPFSFLSNTFSTDDIGLRRRRKFLPILTVSALVHGVVIVYLIYLAIFSPFMNLRFVNKKYRSLDPNEITAKLYYPPGMLSRTPTDRGLTLEQIQERERKRREEVIRREREKEKEREKAERERQKKEEEAKAQSAADSSSTEFGEINEAPIKDIIGKVYAMYQAGNLDLDVARFSVMVSFKIDSDGSIPKSSMKILQSSGSKVVDQNAVEVLWRLGESHGLRPLSVLSSNSIRLDVTDSAARLTITGFAPTRDDAERIRDQLNILLKTARFLQKNSDSMELLAMLHVTSDNNRLIANLSLTRERASEMMRARFAKAEK